jgi:hypothetical protein
MLKTAPLTEAVFYFFLSIPMLSVRSVLSKSVFNACQKFDGLITRPQMGNLREMMLGMLLTKNAYLSNIGGMMAKDVTPRKSTERYSRALDSMDIDACTRQHIACASLSFRHEKVLILCDSGDVQKPYAQEMEHVCVCVDGSNGHAIGRGYPTYACIAYGLESKQQIPLCHHLYSTKEAAFKSQWVEQQKCLGWMAPFFQSSCDRIVVTDRGEDDEKRFLYYTKELHCSFLTRINTGGSSRHLRLVRRGEIADEAISVQEIALQMKGAAGDEKTWKNKKIKKTLTSRITFQEVRLPDHAGLPLYLVLLYTEGFKDPIVLLTDIAVKDAEKAWEVFFWYKKRWEVENFFRAIKQQFGAERFLIRSLPAIRALACVQMLAFSLLRHMHEQAQEGFVLFLHAFHLFCSKWQRTKQSHMDFLQWVRKEWQRTSEDEEISYRSWARHMRRQLSRKPQNATVVFSSCGKW